MTEYLFSYGTLQQGDVQLQLFGRLIPGTPDTLRGFRVAPIEIADPAFLARGGSKDQRIALPSAHKEDALEGTVLELTREELLRADSYEPADYSRVEVVLASGRKAWIYAGATGG